MEQNSPAMEQNSPAMVDLPRPGRSASASARELVLAWDLVAQRFRCRGSLREGVVEGLATPVLWDVWGSVRAAVHLPFRTPTGARERAPR